MDLKGFAIDVDGTITENGGMINLDAAYAIRWLNKMEYKVIFVSGRSVWELFSLAVYMGTTRMVVGENGGVVAYSPIDMFLLADISDSLMAYEYLSKNIKDVKKKKVFPRLTELVLERTFDIEEGKKILEENDLKVSISDSMYGYHLTNKSITKASGLTFAAKRLGLSTKDFIAIGDSDIDVPMFEVCGYSIALGNSPDSVKKKASHTVRSVMGEGFLEAIEHINEKFMRVC